MNEEGYEMKKLSVVILCMLICIQITHAYVALEFTVEPGNDDYYTDTIEANGGKRGRVWNMDSIEYEDWMLCIRSFYYLALCATFDVYSIK